MTARIIDGKATALTIRNEIKERVLAATAAGRRTPGLAVIIVGENPASQSYVRGKRKAAEEAGFYSVVHELPASVPRERLLSLVEDLNNDPKIDGILCQMPLPSRLDETEVTLRISPTKDVDGFHPENVGRIALGLKGFVPCTPLGCMELLARYEVPLEGMRAVVVGRSKIVGLPMLLLLLRKGTGGQAGVVQVCHSRTRDLRAECLNADLIIAATGKPGLIAGGMVKEGAAVIDVGINRIADASAPSGYRLVGDVDFEKAKQRAGWITPVPGGVGPMTIAILLRNTLQAWEGRA